MERSLLKRLAFGAQVQTPEITLARTESEVEDWLATNIYHRVPNIDIDRESLEDYWNSLTRPLKVPLSWAEELKPRRPRRTWERFVEAVEFIIDESPEATMGTSSIYYRKRRVVPAEEVASRSGNAPDSELSQRDSTVSLTSLENSSRRSSPSERDYDDSRSPGGGRDQRLDGIYHHERLHSAVQSPPAMIDRYEWKGKASNTPSPSISDRNYLPMVESERRKVAYERGAPESSDDPIAHNRPKGDVMARKRMQEASNRFNYALFVGFDAEWPSRPPRYNHLYLSDKHSPPALLQIALPDKVLLVSLIQAINNTWPKRQTSWLAKKTDICLWDILEARQKDTTFNILDWRRMPLLRDLLTNKQICKVGEALDNDLRGLKNSAGVDMRGIFDFHADYDKKVQALTQDYFSVSINKVGNDIQRLRKGDWLRPTPAMLDYAAFDALSPLLVHQRIFQTKSPPRCNVATRSRAVEELRKLNQEKLDAAIRARNEIEERRKARKARWGVTRNTDTSVMIEGTAESGPLKKIDYWEWSKGMNETGPASTSEEDDRRQSNRGGSPPAQPGPWDLEAPPQRQAWGWQSKWSDADRNSDSSSPVIQKRIRD